MLAKDVVVLLFGVLIGVDLVFLAWCLYWLRIDTLKNRYQIYNLRTLKRHHRAMKLEKKKRRRDKLKVFIQLLKWNLSLFSNRTRKKAWLEVYEISVKGIEKTQIRHQKLLSDIRNS